MTDIFEDGQATTTPDPAPVQAPAPTVLPDHLKELVGEGKKYASVDKALESIPHAQTHIQRLETELQEMRDKVTKATATDEVYATVKELLEQQRATPSGGTEVDVDSRIDSILDRRLTEREQKARASANVSKVKDALSAKFGDKASEVYKEKAKSLGLSTDFLNSVVAASPEAAFELFGMKPSSTVPAPSSPGVRTDTFTHNAPAPVKTVMGGASSNDVLEAWRAAKPKEN